MKSYRQALVLAAFLSIDIQSAEAHNLFPKLLVGFHQSNEQSLVQLSNEGIFDRAAQKIEKQEREKADAIVQLQNMQEEQQQQEKRNFAHEKNRAEAEKQALQMLSSAQDEAKQSAQEKLTAIAQSADQNQSTDEVEESHGFLGKFNANMNEVLTGDENKKKQVDSIKNQMELNAKISNEFAPKLAEQAVSEALNLGSSKVSVTSDQKKEMKQLLANKIKTKKNDNVAIQTQTALAVFDKLPVAVPKSKPDDVLSEFLEKADKQEQEDREAEQKKDSPSARAAHKYTAKKEEEPMKDDMLDNPISQMTMMHHPDLVKQAQKEDLESMARGEDALVETSFSFSPKTRLEDAFQSFS